MDRQIIDRSTYTSIDIDMHIYQSLYQSVYACMRACTNAPPHAVNEYATSMLQMQDKSATKRLWPAAACYEDVAVALSYAMNLL